MRRQSPFKSQNKENSPLSNFNQQGFSQTSLQKQRHTIYNPSKRNEIESLFPIRSNLSTAKSVSNINLVKVPGMPNSKPLFNVNLSNATEKASEAIKQQNDFARIFQSYLEKPQHSDEKVHDKNQNEKSQRQNVDQNNNTMVKKTSNAIELKEKEKKKSASSQISNSSKSSSRQNSPHKSLSKVSNSKAPPSNEDVEMVSTSSCSSNKENNADNLNETNNEPSKLSISEKLKLFSNNASDSVTIGAKKPNSIHNSAKINFKFQVN